MGAAQSTPNEREHVVEAPAESSGSTSVFFSPSLIDQLSHPPSDPNAKPIAKSNDDAILRRLNAESAHIRQEEEKILSSISAALEKENMEKEKPGMSSDVLGKDIEQVREKVERLVKQRSEREGQDVREAKQGVVQCYA